MCRLMFRHPWNGKRRQALICKSGMMLQLQVKWLLWLSFLKPSREIGEDYRLVDIGEYGPKTKIHFTQRPLNKIRKGREGNARLLRSLRSSLAGFA